MPRATVAIEDRRFYEHGGVDYVGICAHSSPTFARARSCRAARRSPSSSSATSTSRASDRQAQADRGVPRGQARRNKWSKNRILTAYMNQVYYGNHAYGIEAAAETYFSKRRRT